jgi:hypothetical protein
MAAIQRRRHELTPPRCRTGSHTRCPGQRPSRPVLLGHQVVRARVAMGFSGPVQAVRRVLCRLGRSLGPVAFNLFRISE